MPSGSPRFNSCVRIRRKRASNRQTTSAANCHTQAFTAHRCTREPINPVWLVLLPNWQFMPDQELSPNQYKFPLTTKTTRSVRKSTRWRHPISPLVWFMVSLSLEWARFSAAFVPLSSSSAQLEAPPRNKWSVPPTESNIVGGRLLLPPLLLLQANRKASNELIPTSNSSRQPTSGVSHSRPSFASYFAPVVKHIRSSLVVSGNRWQRKSDVCWPASVRLVKAREQWSMSMSADVDSHEQMRGEKSQDEKSWWLWWRKGRIMLSKQWAAVSGNRLEH